MSQFDISVNGFLPEYCVNELPEKLGFYKPMFNYILEKERDVSVFKNIVHNLPTYNESIYNLDNLNITQIRFIYTFLSIASHIYIHSKDENRFQSLPAEIGVLWVQSSDVLGIKTALTHAAVDLYNWRLIDEKSPVSLENIETIFTMTGTESENWFYKVMIVTEYEGHTMLKQLEKIHDNPIIKKDNIEQFLKAAINSLENMTLTIKRMDEHCDHKEFYENIRIFLGGCTDLHINSPQNYVLTYNGGSGAQSSLLQIFDAILHVKHVDHEKEFLDNQLAYMPKKHREFLKQVKENDVIFDWVLNQGDEEVKQLYNKCIRKLTSFRSAHMGLIHRYIVKFNPNASGTGGTSPVSVLSKIIQTTEKSAIEFTPTPKISTISKCGEVIKKTMPYVVTTLIAVMAVLLCPWRP